MNTFRYLFAFITLALAFVGCEDDTERAILKTEVAPNEFLAPASSSYVLTLENKDAKLETFKWTAPDYGFPAGVTYELQIDHASNNFANPVEVLTTSSLSADVMVGAFNDFLLGLGLTPEEPAEIDLRVVATISDKVPPVFSSKQTITVTPYATVFPSIYGMGAGMKGWGPWPDNAVELVSSEFKKYYTITQLINGEAFRFFEQLDWGPVSYNYPYFTSVSSTLVNANDGDSNFRVAGASGWYEINVDLVNKTVTAEPTEEPQLYMVGAAVGGWDQALAVKMTYIKPGVFEGTANFINDTFRFFAQNDWGPTSYNYPYFTTVDPNFENANDGDSNLRYVGTPGSQKVTVDLINKTVTLGDIPDPELYMTGDALNGWSWDEGIYVPMTYIGGNEFEATATFTNGKAFRFFAQTDWGPTSYNYPYFTTVDADFENAADGDSNLRYIGTTGARTIRVNLTTKVVTLQ